MDHATIANFTVAAIMRMVGEFSAGLAKGTGEAVGEKNNLWQWLRHRGGSEVNRAVDHVEKAPRDTSGHELLRIAITKALETDPELATELCQILPSITSSVDIRLNAGNGAKAIQQHGTGNSGSIG